MFTSIIASLALLTSVVSTPTVLASTSLNLDNRHSVASVNEVFKYNILHTLDYLGYEFELKPGETFAFHDLTLPKYSSVVKTTGVYFNGAQGFKSDGFLMGDGVCHLASIMYMAAIAADLEAYAPSDHDIAVIPDVPDEYGVSIYVDPTRNIGPMNNLYITNNRGQTIKFVFTQQASNLVLEVVEK